MNNYFLAHYGILGMKWGIRKYQNPDGTLTAAGRARYRNQSAKERNSDTVERINDTINRSKNSNVTSAFGARLDSKNPDYVSDMTTVATNIFLSRPDQYDKLKKAIDLSKESDKYYGYAKGYDLTGEGNPRIAEESWNKVESIEKERQKAINDYLSSVIGPSYNPEAKIKDMRWGAYNAYNKETMTPSEFGKSYFNGRLMNTEYNKIEKAISSYNKKSDAQKAKDTPKLTAAERELKAKNRMKPKVAELFKKYPDLKYDFGRPDQIDDWEYFEYIVENFYEK